MQASPEAGRPVSGRHVGWRHPARAARVPVPGRAGGGGGPLPARVSPGPGEQRLIIIIITLLAQQCDGGQSNKTKANESKDTKTHEKIQKPHLHELRVSLAEQEVAGGLSRRVSPSATISKGSTWGQPPPPPKSCMRIFRYN